MLLLFAIAGGCTGGGRIRVGDKADTAVPPAAVLPAFVGDAPKNLLMLSVDTLRGDHVSPHGDTTPFLDTLVAEGFVLDDFTACSNWTTASTACVTSGATNIDLAPSRGMIPIMFDGVLADIPSPEPMLASWLGDAGYSSLLVTSNAWFGAAYGNAQGYDRIRTPGHVRAETVWEEASRAMDPAQGGAALPSPWYLHLHFFEPHRPYTAPPEYILGLEDLPPIAFDLSTAAGQEEADVAIGQDPPVLTTDEIDAIQTSMRLRYAGEVRWLDDGLKAVWAELEAQGLLDDTLVVFWTDHGEELWEHGPPGHGYLMHRGENDGAAIFWAKNIVPGSWAGPTQAIDLTPTVLALFGIDPPVGPTGYPVGTAPPDRARFAFTDAHLGPVQTVRKGTGLMHFRWMTGGPDAALEYYDLATDPRELNDLYDPAAPSDEVRELWSLLRPQIEAAEPWIADDPRGWSIVWPPGL
jgi:arylsulfatase A-like enzyme